MIRRIKIFMSILFLPVFIGVLGNSEINKKTNNPYEKAIFAGGCFWCMETPFEDLPGVISVLSGYTGGDKDNPTYEEVSSGTTGHLEAIMVTFDPTKISYRELLDIFFKQIDPTDQYGQFVDRGKQYASAIFYLEEEQKRLAEEKIKDLTASRIFEKPIVTKVIKAGKFFNAEEYHQDYYKKNPLKYKFYRFNSGRDSYLEKQWKGKNSTSLVKTKERLYIKQNKEELKKRLTPLQYKVTQENATEAAFKNEYWDKHEEGIYVDIVTGEPLFISADKFDSGTGWPSFTKPVEKDSIVLKEDNNLFMKRTEVRSKYGDSHLGHLFTDGPKPEGLRYCINSAALRFIPKAAMEKEGYGEYLKLFPD